MEELSRKQEEPVRNIKDIEYQQLAIKYSQENKLEEIRGMSYQSISLSIHDRVLIEQA